jgi:hypothetical protein
VAVITGSGENVGQKYLAGEVQETVSGESKDEVKIFF